MKKLMVLLLICLPLAVCCACYGETAGETGTAYQLYFMWRDLKESPGGGALETETIYLQDMEEAEPQQLAEALLTELLNGPLDERLKSPVPAGTSLLSLEVVGSQALVDLSAAYGTLSGVALTLADSAVTMTLTQLPEISRVQITMRGQELAYREKQTFTARDILLAPVGDVVSTVPVTLYFLNGDGILTGEERTLALYEGDTQVSAVVRAVENGPEDKELTAVLPEGFRVKSVWLEEDVCYVNLSSALLEELPPETQLFMPLRALAKSLCSLETVKETQFLVDGEFAESYGSVNVENSFLG